jgi:hypothetical protein
MNAPVDVSALSEAAQEAVEAFVVEHRSGAIPALIGACVMWAVMHGGADVVRGSLNRALRMADEMEAEIKGKLQ